jgi:hypothetical protein
MTAGIRACVAAVAALAALVVAAPVDAAPPLIKLLAGDTREIYVDRNAVNVGFPVELPARAHANRIATTVIAVTLGSRSDLRLKNAFHARLKPPVRAGTALLLVRVGLRPALEAGTYHLLITAAGNVGKPKRKRAQRLSVSIVVPAGKLEVPKTLTIEKTLSVFGIGGSTESPKLQLRETSSQSRLSRIYVAQIGAASEASRATSSSIQFDPARNVGPGSSRRIGYKLNGTAFDHVGTVTGSGTVRAAELSSPVAFDYVVNVRYSTDLIFLLAALGLVTGFLVRILLQRIIDVSRARQAAADLELRIENAEHDGDELLRHDLRAARTALAPAFDFWRSAGAVEQNVNDAEKIYREAVAAYAKRTREALDRQATLSRIIDTPWTLPRELDPAFTTARNSLAKTKQLLDDGTTDVAADEQQAAETALKHAVADAAAGWQDDAEGLFVATEMSPPPPAQLRDAIARAVKKARASAQQIPSAPAAELKDVLAAFDQAVRDFDKLRPLLAAIEAEVRAVRSRVPSAAATLDAALEGLVDAVGDQRDEPALVKQRYTAVMTALDDAVSQNGGDEALREEGRYADALKSKVPTALGSSATAPAAAAAILPLALDAPGPSLPGNDTSVVVLQALPPARVLQRRIASTLAAAWFLQWLVLSALFVALSYVLFSDGWTGTWQQMVSVFLWAFALDVSANTLIDQGKKPQAQATPADG